MIYPGEADLKRCRPLAILPPDLKRRLEEAWAEVRSK
jgi:hypothetical protein